MRIAYFDCFSGICGSMIIGALLDAGVDLELLQREIGKLDIDGYKLDMKKTRKNGIAGTDFTVELEGEQRERGLHDILRLIDKSGVSQGVKVKSKAVFTRLAEAEAKVHQAPVERIHFHEVGAVDAIIDIVGSIFCLEQLGIERVYASPLPLGSGSVRCVHGLLPVPAPAVVELVKNTPVYDSGIRGELVTPTGAALITTLSHSFGAIPPMVLRESGYGAGRRNLEIPNLLRVMIGDELPQLDGLRADSLQVHQTDCFKSIVHEHKHEQQCRHHHHHHQPSERELKAVK